MKKVFISLATFVALFTLKASAQRDHTFPKGSGFQLDSLSIRVSHLRTQNADQDTLERLSDFVMQYFGVENDTLYACFPRGYRAYSLDDALTGMNTVNKEMIVYERPSEEKPGYTQLSYFRGWTLIGKKVPICPTKKQARLYMSL